MFFLKGKDKILILERDSSYQEGKKSSRVYKNSKDLCLFSKYSFCMIIAVSNQTVFIK